MLPTTPARKQSRSVSEEIWAARRPPERRPSPVRARTAGSLGGALLTTLAATVAPGTGHLILRRRRTGGLILGVFLVGVLLLAVLVLTQGRQGLLTGALSTRTLVVAGGTAVAAALAWAAVIVRTWWLARPRGLGAGGQFVGLVVVAALCLLIAAPLGFAANLANSQRTLLDTVFTGGGGTAAEEAIAKPRLNILLVGSDAGPDRVGARTDTMMVASLDTRTGRTTLFGLPRNIEFAQFPPGSPMAEKFPKGFHDNDDPTSGDYLLNAVYAYGREHPALAPATPTPDPGMNLLHQTVSFMLGLPLDYYLEVNMAGFASLVDALGGVTVDVGPTPVPIGGISPSGRRVEPDGYIPAGVQDLTGTQALAFARSRTDTTDYARMGRQRCLISTILAQKTPADLLANFQAVARAATANVATNIPQQVLPSLVSLAGNPGGLTLESVSFDPGLADPEADDGRFNTGRPNFPYMREVVQNAIDPPAISAAPPAPSPSPTDPPQDGAEPSPEPSPAAPAPVAASC